jgi:predicted nucleotidyltransferase
MTLLKKVHELGLPPEFSVIHLFEGGSKLHGARIEGKSDLDIYGVFVEPRLRLFGLEPYEHFVSGSGDETRRNTASDIDCTLYSLRRWAQLAVKGNPTALNFLFVSNTVHSGDNNNFWMASRTYLREAIVAKSAAGHYIGFVQGQMKRLMGVGTGKHGQRLELQQEFGYDTKAGMHAVRLLGEGKELMETGAVTFPRPNVPELLEIRAGAWSLDTLCKRVSHDINELEIARDKSQLRDKPDRSWVSGILTSVYMDVIR